MGKRYLDMKKMELDERTTLVLNDDAFNKLIPMENKLNDGNLLKLLNDLNITHFIERHIVFIDSFNWAAAGNDQVRFSIGEDRVDSFKLANKDTIVKYCELDIENMFEEQQRKYYYLLFEGSAGRVEFKYNNKKYTMKYLRYNKKKDWVFLEKSERANKYIREFLISYRDKINSFNLDNYDCKIVMRINEIQ